MRYAPWLRPADLTQLESMMTETLSHPEASAEVPSAEVPSAEPSSAEAPSAEVSSAEAPTMEAAAVEAPPAEAAPGETPAAEAAPAEAAPAEAPPADEEPPTGLKGHLERWARNPPAHLMGAMTEAGITAEELEEYSRASISSEEMETLRQVLVNGAASGQVDDAALWARMAQMLDPRERAWDRVVRAKNSGEVLTAPVSEATKGGVVVDLGVRGFVPSSQIGLSVPKNLDQYVGRSLRLRVLEVDRRRQTVVLSNRVVMEEERAQKRRGAMDRLKDQEGEVKNGTIRRLTDIGAFVDVGGVDGLLHVSEISWKRVEHPSEVLKVGQKVDVKILRVDADAGRISLSIRRLTPDPWEEIRRTLHPGESLTVKVLKTVPQGAVVELPHDFEGFIPISELAPRRVNSPEEVVQVGQEVEALILELQPRDRRVVLSLRKLEQKRERAVVDTHQRKQQTTSRSNRTTLGDLFGHLFEEYQTDPEPEPAREGGRASREREGSGPSAPAATGPAPDEETVTAAAPGDDPAGGETSPNGAGAGAVHAEAPPETAESRPADE